MPLYDYECVNCGDRRELFFRLTDIPEQVKCPECGELAVKIIVHGHGAIQCDSVSDVSWLPSAIENLQPDDERPLETRGEYKKYLKDKNIIPVG